MSLRRSLAALAFAAAIPVWVATAQTTPGTNTCLAFVSQNLAKGRENFYAYFRFSNQQVTLREGDVLVYSIFLDPKNPEPKGGIDADFTDSGTPLRDLNLADQNGIRAHGDGVLTPAVGKWYTRKIALTGQAGRTTADWTLVFEGDTVGQYAQFVDDVYVQHADGTKTWVYQDGNPTARGLDGANGYSKFPDVVAIEQSRVQAANLSALVAEVSERGRRFAALENARKDIDLAKEFLKRTPDPALEGHVREAEALLNQAEQRNATPEEIQAVLHAANHALSHTHPVMQQYTGHLVGHAHIDLQWLWEWQEGMVFTHDTFNQAVKFMDEFPGFTFSQSSSWLYKATEQQYPELFKKIQEKVKKGQWEIVGGRVCEGDENMISPESHARHFLYGQRYFREKFGRTAKVAWEPDTFGHTAQMPQIVKLGGCEDFYFCRGGKGKPLFWWQALDGTKVLAFDEPATGSWYNSDLSYQQFRELLDFQDKTGSKDTLWVYGVGNHGGGPTREMIQQALEWQKDPTKPRVKFSTATQFFDKLRTYDLKKIPTVADELNPVFDGCYTTHSEVKQLNRQAEALTTAAESIAALASLKGFDYPKASFRRNWEEICYNHHHDTLPGSGIHPPYEKTKLQLSRVALDDRDIIQRAMESLAVQVTAPKGISTMVFNPTGWKRSGWVETFLVKSGFDGDSGVTPTNCVAVAPDGAKFPVQVIDPISRRIRFWAGDVPAFGYKVYNFQQAPRITPPLTASADTFETPAYRVRFDRAKGYIASLFDKRTNRELAAGGLGRLEAHYEDPGGMSAWVLGRINKVEALTPTGFDVHEQDGRTEIEIRYLLRPQNDLSRETPVVQRFHIDPTTEAIETDVDVDWNIVGSGREATPMLRVAFDTSLKAPSATYEVPFGSIIRKGDGQEYPALQWGELRDIYGGLAILNDSKHGYSSSGGTMRLTLIRSSFEPDPNPNPGHHHWRYAIWSHGSQTTNAEITKQATDFNIPMFAASVPYDAHGDAPLQFSPLAISDPNVVPTALKQSEDGKDLVLRAFEATGKPSRGWIAPKIALSGAGVVNFVEDPIGPAASDANGVALPMRGFEIKTVRLRLRR